MKPDPPARVGRRAAACAAVAAGLGLAGCAWLRRPPPGPVTLRIAGERLPGAAVAAAYRLAAPTVRVEFAPGMPGADVMFVTDAGPRVGDQLQALDPLLSLMAFQPVGVDPLAWAALAVGHRRWGVPFALSTAVVLFDAGVFAAAAVPPPRHGWTWADLLASCRRLQAARGGGVVAAFDDIGSSLWWALVKGFGGRPLDRAGRVVAEPDAGTIAGLQAYAVLRGYASGASPWGDPKVAPAHRPAMAMRQFLLGPDLAAWSRRGLNLGVAAFPRLPAGPLAPAAVWGHGIIRGAAQAGAALDFLLWTIGYDGQRLVGDLGLHPVLAGVPSAAPQLHAPAGVDPAAVRVGGRTPALPPAALRAPPEVAGSAVRRLIGVVSEASVRAAWREVAAVANRAGGAAG